MTTLDLEARLADPDAAYRAIIEAHRGLTLDQSAAFNAALILVLANQVGDLDVLNQALKLAKQSLSVATPVADVSSR